MNWNTKIWLPCMAIENLDNKMASAKLMGKLKSE